MRSRFLPLALASLFFPLCSFAAATDQNNSDVSGTTATQNANTSGTADVQKKEGEILETLIVIDNHEINGGKLAEQRSSNSDVKDFAKTMQSDHKKNLDDNQDLSKKINVTPVSSDKSDMLEKKGQRELKRLESASAKQFDVLYMDTMIKGHKEALQFIDGSLPKISNSDLADYLKETRKTVAHHLDMAKEVRGKLKQNGSNNNQ